MNLYGEKQQCDQTFKQEQQNEQGTLKTSVLEDKIFSLY